MCTNHTIMQLLEPEKILINFDKLNFIDESPLEKNHNNVYKFILRIKKCGCNIASKSE